MRTVGSTIPFIGRGASKSPYVALSDSPTEITRPSGAQLPDKASPGSLILIAVVVP